MRLWRISNYADLTGTGGLKTAGRWHNKGLAIVYLAENPALALLETLVHFDLTPDGLPDNYQLLEIEYNEPEGIMELDITMLGQDWANNQALTRHIGDQWLVAASSLLLKVPSAIMPRSHNYLMNPKHPLSSKCTIISSNRYPLDKRFSQTAAP